MNIRKITSACALTFGVLALPAMALNTQGTVYGQNGQYGQYGQNGQHQRKNDRLKAMDTNGDGIITRDEWRGDDASFRKHDRNGDGVISAADRQYGKGNGQQGRRNGQQGNWNGQRDND